MMHRSGRLARVSSHLGATEPVAPSPVSTPEADDPYRVPVRSPHPPAPLGVLTLRALLP